jgi:hypothetical protein
MRRRVALFVLGVLPCCAAIGAQADPLAPPGAEPDWLPKEEWVREHWIPYEQDRLARLLHTDITGLREWMRGDRPLAGLVRRRRLVPSRLAWRLVEPWRGDVSRRTLRELHERALRTLTQGHLGLHLFSHPTHSRSLNRLYMQLHESSASARPGLSLLDIAEADGRSAAWLRRKTLRMLRRSARRGVRLEATPARQARRWLRFQEPAALKWLEWRPGGGRDVASSRSHVASSRSVGAAIASVWRSATRRPTWPTVWGFRR